MPPGKANLNLLPIARVQAEEIVAYLSSRLVGNKLFFGGSYIRQRPVCGDIDLAILRNPDTDVSISNLELSNGVKVLTKGNKQTRQILEFNGFEFQLDIWFVDNPGQWGPMCMFVAGNAVVNIRQRQAATRQGYVLSQYAVTKDGQPTQDFLTEQSVYNFFKWPWLPYEMRNQ